MGLPLSEGSVLQLNPDTSVSHRDGEIPYIVWRTHLGGRDNGDILDLVRRRLCPDSRLVRFQIPEIRWYQSRNVRRSD